MPVPPLAPAPYTSTDALTSALGATGAALIGPYGLLILGFLIVLLIALDVLNEFARILPWGSALIRLLEMTMGPGDLYTGYTGMFDDKQLDVGYTTVRIHHYHIDQGIIRIPMHDGKEDIIRRPVSLYDARYQLIASVEDDRDGIAWPIEAIGQGKPAIGKLRKDENGRLIEEITYLKEGNKELLSALHDANEKPLQLMLNIANSLGQVKDKMGWKTTTFVPPGKASAAEIAARQGGGEE